MDDLDVETSNSLQRNTVNYLHNISEMVPDHLNILKSFYSSKCRIVEVRSNVHLPVNPNKAQGRCPRCCLHLPEAPAVYHIDSEDKKSKFAEKVINKTKCHKGLTRFQRSYRKNINIKKENALEITCKFCYKTIKHKLTKPEFKPEPGLLPSVKIGNKKKRKKDKLCGLAADIVQEVRAERKAMFAKKKSNLNRTTNNAIMNKKDIARAQTRNKQKLVAIMNAKDSIKKIDTLVTFLQ